MLNCRFCGSNLESVFVDLGVSPPSNSFLRAEDLQRMEPFYPLTVYVCDSCLLVQLPAYHKPEEIFSDYAYFSSYSESWLQHAKRYTTTMIDRFGFGRESLVIEIASNDGYLLQYFREREVPVLGIEPASNVAKVAEERGVPTLSRFFGTELAESLVREGKRADLLLGNNVLAHVPDLNDFVRGLSILLAPAGVITMEFPHLVRLVEGNQFDTIYHEHFSYFSLIAVERIFARHGLTLFDVEELETHGGSLRIYARHESDQRRPVEESVATLRAAEVAAGFDRVETYKGFDTRVRQVKMDLLEFLIETRVAGKRVVGYGAPAKGNTLLNYCGIRTDFIDYTVDRSPHKQGLYLPGTRIPILPVETIFETRPDYLFILPWNLRNEIAGQMKGIRDWGGKFVVAIPQVEVFE